jgi:hypothetical protein
MELRGTRYITDANKKIARFIENDLRYLDWRETEEFYRSVDGKLSRESLALLGCNDRYYLLTRLCSRADAVHPWLFRRCREIEEEPDGYLDLWARYHYKSTLGTFAGNIQEILCDPEVTIAIMSCTNDVARPFLQQIQLELETNDLLKQVYADVLWQTPRVEAPSWSLEKGLIVRRKSNPKECTIEAFGVVDGMRTGKHYRILDYDDLVTERNASNPEMIAKVTERYELSDNLGSHKGTKKRHKGTRYNFGDTYGVLLERGTLKPRIYAATEDGTLKGKPVFLSPERWAEVKNVQRTTAAAQMLQNPLADTEQVFRPEYLAPYYTRPALLNVYILVDPSKGATQRSDRTAIAVIGLDTAGNYYFLDGYRHRMPLSERWLHLKALHQKWSNEIGVSYVKVGYEIYGQQADIEVLKDYMEREKYVFALHEVNTPRQGKHSKNDRIERLEPDLRNGRFYIPGIIYHSELSADCLWSVWSAADAKREPGKAHNVGEIVYRPLKGQLKEHIALEQSAQHYRIVKPIKRRDEDRSVYDLTREFIAELLFYPFAPKKDLVDATSRIYDIGANPATKKESAELEPTTFPDS